MKKKVIIITTSLRKDSNSTILAEHFAKGATEAGHDVEVIALVDKTIGFCRGCLACQVTHHCTIADDGEIIAGKMLLADSVVFATPVYYYGMSGQMKTMLDRANPLYAADYAFRDIYLLAVAAEDEESTIDGTVVGLEGWVACFEKARLTGQIFAGGVGGPKEIIGHKALTEAYTLGKSL